MNKKKVSQNSGFTLVEIMIAVSIMSVVALSISSLMKNLTKTSAKAQADSDILLATNEINAILANPRSCQVTFGAGAFPSNGNGTISLPYSTLPSIQSKPNLTSTQVTKYPTAATSPNFYFGNNNTQIDSYLLAVDPANAANGAILTIKYRKKAIINNNHTGGLIAKSINLYVEYDTATGTKIAACRSVSSAFDDVWSRVAANQNDIYYSGGKVGIGTSTPTSMLQVVNGLIRSDLGTTGPSIIGTGTGSNFQITHDGTSNVGLFNSGGGIQFRDTNGTTNLVSILPGGSVGVGTTAPVAGTKLDVQGGNVNTSGSLTTGAGVYAAGNLNTAGRSQTDWYNINTGSIGAWTSIYSYGPVCTGNASGGCNAASGVVLGINNTAAANNIPNTGSVLFNSGNVGIGTTTPATSLDIVSSTGVRVTGTGAVSGYAPIIINGQTTSDLATWISSTTSNEVPTKNWVVAAIAASFSTNSQLVGSITTNIANFAASNTMQVIAGDICLSSKIVLTINGVIQPPVPGSPSGVTCTYNVPNIIADQCTAGPPNSPCATIYSNVFQAGTVSGTSVGFCGNGGCASKFGKSVCPPNTYVYGFSHGVLLCTNNIARPASVPGWDTSSIWSSN